MLTPTVRKIQWESTLERDWLLHQGTNLSVRKIYSQPNTFDYCHDGRWHRYTPDFNVQFRRGDQSC